MRLPHLRQLFRSHEKGARRTCKRELSYPLRSVRRISAKPSDATTQSCRFSLPFPRLFLPCTQCLLREFQSVLALLLRTPSLVEFQTQRSDHLRSVGRQSVSALTSELRDAITFAWSSSWSSSFFFCLASCRRALRLSRRRTLAAFADFCRILDLTHGSVRLTVSAAEGDLSASPRFRISLVWIFCDGDRCLPWRGILSDERG